MYRRADKLKRAIACAAVLLSLSTLAQGSGMFCYLGACGESAVSQLHGEHSCCQRVSVCRQACCGDDQQSAAHCDDPDNHRHDSCPCPEQCWCHVAPQPLEPPKTSALPVEQALQAVCNIDNPHVGGPCPQPTTSTRRAAPPGVGDQPALARCAQLCRFLI